MEDDDFETIDVDLSPGVVEALIDTTVRALLPNQAIDVYMTSLDEGKSRETSLNQALLACPDGMDIYTILSPASVDVYRRASSRSGTSPEDAAAEAFMNEGAIIALKAALERDEKKPQVAKVTKMIEVTFQREGIHMYPAALTDPTLATGDWDDVSFLGHPHRHVFHFKVAIEVTHNDRDIEFIQFKRWLERLYGDSTLELSYKSCEMISDDLYNAINVKYPNRNIVISVFEDGENGSTTTYNVHS